MALINDFLSLIYPRKCEACSNLLFKHEQMICNLCSLNLPKSNYHKQNENELARVFAGRAPFDHALSYFVFEKSGKVQKLLHSIKYEEQKDLAKFLGNAYAKELAKDNFSVRFDLIIPVPLHERKLKARGFNQSEWFAKGLSEEWGVPLDTTSMVRVLETSTQTKKRKYERWENVQGIFEIRNPSKLHGKNILIVDDVITTGATIEAAWMALKDVNEVKVSVASLAFAARQL
jgi:ComF family protein